MTLPACPACGDLTTDPDTCTGCGYTPVTAEHGHPGRRTRRPATDARRLDQQLHATTPTVTKGRP